MDVYEAVDLLLANHVANAPVVDDQDRLIGFLSEKDCMETLLDGAYNSNPSTTVDRCMTTNLTTVEEETDLLTVAEIFLQKAYRRLPVMQGETMVGQISRRDFLQAISDWTRPEQAVKGPSTLYLSRLADRALPFT
jgi:predicted transcriptional regulator